MGRCKINYFTQKFKKKNVYNPPVHRVRRYWALKMAKNGHKICYFRPLYCFLSIKWFQMSSGDHLSIQNNIPNMYVNKVSCIWFKIVCKQRPPSQLKLFDHNRSGLWRLKFRSYVQNALITP